MDGGYVLAATGCAAISSTAEANKVASLDKDTLIQRRISHEACSTDQYFL